MHNDTLFYVYEPEHISKALAYLEAHPGCRLIAGDFSVEQKLKERNTPFRSVRDVGEDDPAPLLAWCQDAAREWYRLPSMEFYVYKNTALGEVFEPMLDFYLQRLLKAERLFARLLAQHPECRRLVVPHTCMEPSNSAGPLAPFEIRVVVDGAIAAGKAATVNVELLGREPQMPQDHVYSDSRLRAIVYSVYNRIIGMLQPPRALRIYVGDQWSHVALFAPLMPDAEFIFMERKELVRIPWRSRWVHRIRFMHPADEPTRSAAAAAQANYASLWPARRKETLAQGFPGPHGRALAAPIAAAIDYLVEKYAERALLDFEGFKNIFHREAINRVLLRVGISGRQPHFFVATRVAELLDIPSYELQHALEVADPTTVHARLATRYLGAYGEGARELFVRQGYDPARIRPVGSPRFDAYTTRPFLSSQARAGRQKKLMLDPDRPVVFVGMPAESPDLYPAHFSSYDTAALLETLVQMGKRIPGLQYILKFRPRNLSSSHRDKINELFPQGGVVLAEFEEPFDLLRISDVACVANSTLLYEAHLARVPVVLYPVRHHDIHFLAEFKDAGCPGNSPEEAVKGVARLLQDVSFKEDMLRQGKDFIEKRCCFDGKSAARMAAFLRHPEKVSAVA